MCTGLSPGNVRIIVLILFTAISSPCQLGSSIIVVTI